jgi:heme-degrading monooxygenase HmoA
MFARVAEFSTRSDLGRDFIRVVLEKVLPILEAQPGFVDASVLTTENDEPYGVLGVSIWRDRVCAERYARKQYPKIEEMLHPLLETAPRIRTFRVAAISSQAPQDGRLRQRRNFTRRRNHPKDVAVSPRASIARTKTRAHAREVGDG